MSRLGLALSLAGIAATLLGRAGSAASAPARPNIVLIVADQMTPFMLGPYGQRAARTPALDHLARRGVVFDAAYTNSPLCVPSRTALFTGRMPSRLDVFDNASEWPAHVPGFVHALRAAGYRTAVAGKCHFIGPDQLHGFEERLTPDVFPSSMAWVPDWTRGAVYNSGTSVQEMFKELGPTVTNRQIAYDTQTFDAAMAWLSRGVAGRDNRPFLLNVSFTQPHDPFSTTQEFWDLYEGVPIPMPQTTDDAVRLSPTYEWIRVHHGLDRGPISSDTVVRARRSYLGMVSWVDDRIGRLLSELDRLGLAENTLVVVTSDHGEMLGEHGLWSKRVMLEWSARVPLMIAWPGHGGGGRHVGAPVSLVDLLPTLLEIGGVDASEWGLVRPAIEGESLMPLLDGRPASSDRPVLAEYLGEGVLQPVRMLRQGAYKYIATGHYAPQLFDLKSDPNETRNVAEDPAFASIRRDLERTAIEGWDAEALRARVLASQRERRLINKSLGGPLFRMWDYEAVSRRPPL